MTGHLHWFNELKREYPDRKKFLVEDGYDEITEADWNNTEKLVKEINELLKGRKVYFMCYVASVDIHVKDDKGDILINVDRNGFVASVSGGPGLGTMNVDKMVEFLRKHV